jgi:hypothetical protein
MRYNETITKPETKFNPFGIKTPTRQALARHLKTLPKSDRKELVRRLIWVGNYATSKRTEATFIVAGNYLTGYRISN